MSNNEDFKIRSYDGQDAFYTGTDEDYEEFLKSANLIQGSDTEAESVENTQKINLNETINLQNVIDRFKKTAGDLGHTAKTFKESVVSRMDSLKSKKEDEEEAPAAENVVSSGIDTASEKLKSSFDASAEKLNEIKNEIKGDMQAMAGVPDKVGNVDTKLDYTNNALADVADKLTALADKLEAIEKSLGDDKKELADSNGSLQNTLGEVGEGITEIRQAVSSVSRLNDSVFDLKNTQMNTKNAVANLETAFSRLKKKCVLGVTVISFLCAIIIALQILLMLS